jgi:hypothetical protein
VGVEDLDFLPAQELRELCDSQQAGRGIDSSAEVYFHDFDWRIFEALQERAFAAEASDGYPVAFGIEAASQFNGLSFSAADHERVEKKENPDGYVFGGRISTFGSGLRTQSSWLQKKNLLRADLAIRITGVTFSSKHFIV